MTMATKPEFLVAKEEMLVVGSLAAISDAILSLRMAILKYSAWVKPAYSLAKVKG